MRDHPPDGVGEAGGIRLQTRLQIVKTASPFYEKRETRGLGLV